VDALVSTALNVRVCQFEKRGDDRGVLTADGNPGRECVEVVIGGLTTAPVGD
jgi:hypothetical protein